MEGPCTGTKVPGFSGSGHPLWCPYRYLNSVCLLNALSGLVDGPWNSKGARAWSLLLDAVMSLTICVFCRRVSKNPRLSRKRVLCTVELSGMLVFKGPQ